MNRNRLFSLVVVVSFCLPFTYGGCGGGGGGDNNFNFNPVSPIMGSGYIVEETRSVTGATGVVLSGVADVTIEQGVAEELILETDDNLMTYILTNVRGGILEIRKDPSVSLRPSRRRGTGIDAHLTLNSLDSITLSGVGSIKVPDDLTTTRLELTLSGVGDIEISNLDAETSDVLISGVGGVEVGGISIAGQVDDQIVTLLTFDGPGDYDGENLDSETVDIEIAGSESATVRVSTTLIAHITGSGSVFYHGSPSVTRTGSGPGRLVQLSP